MLFDFHVHMGQYFDDYYTPPRILRTLRLAEITHFAYSSTSGIVTDDPDFLLEERVSMHELSDGRAKPVLWVTHDMLKRSRDLSLYMSEKGGKICGLKIHGESEKWVPVASDKCFRRVFDIARDLGLFVKVHSGEKNEWCNSGNFGCICKIYSEVPVILAHGRPLTPAIDVLMNNPNAYVDTSFMPHNQLRYLIHVAREQGFINRILFGTDTPIPGRYLKGSLPRHLRARIATSKQIAGKDWKMISCENVKKLISI